MAYSNGPGVRHGASRSAANSLATRQLLEDGIDMDVPGHAESLCMMRAIGDLEDR